MVFKSFSHNMEINQKNLVESSKTLKGFKAIGFMHGHYCEETINLMRELQPGIKSIAFISDKRLSSAFVRQKMADVMKKRFSELRYINLEMKDVSTSQLLDTLKTFDRSVGVIFYGWYEEQTNKENRSNSTDNVKKMISAYSHVPVFTLSDYDMKNDGSLSGGVFNSGVDIANEINRTIDRIYKNESVSYGSVINIEHPQIYLNYQSLKNKGINLKLLPSNAIYFDREVSFYDNFKYFIQGLIILLIVLVIILIKYARSERKLHYEQEKEVLHLTRYKQLFANMPIAYMRYFVRKKFGSENLTYNLISENIVAETFFSSNLKQMEHTLFSLENKEKILSVSNGIETFRTEIYQQKINKHFDVFFCPSEQHSIMDIFLVDKTEQVEASRQVIEYAKMNSRILGMLPDTIIIFKKDLSVELILNPSSYNYLAPSSSIVGKKTSEFYVQGVTELLDKSIAKALVSNDMVSFDYEIVNGDNTYYFNARLNTLSGTKVCCIIHEYTNMMTNQKQLETAKNELEHVNHKLQMVINAASVKPWTYDVKNDMIVIGDKMKWKSDSDYVYSEDKEYFLNKVRDVATHGIDGEVYSYVVRLRNFENNQFEWHEVRCSVDQRDNHGNVTMIIGSVVNIDMQRQIEDNLRKAKEKAEESSRLKSTFLANVSHEIRTPLNAIVGFSNILASPEQLTQEQKQKFVSSINMNNELLLQLINDILDLSLMDTGMLRYNYAQEDVCMIIKRVVDKQKEKVAGSNVTLMASSDMPLSCITYTDIKRFVQVLDNFITNAIKFTFEGHIIVGCRMIDDDHYICYVKDSGIGIEPAYHHQIFERFEKLNSFKQGTGLGLPICKSIVEALGGVIGVDSEKGKGSTFWFTMPVLKQIPM